MKTPEIIIRSLLFLSLSIFASEKTTVLQRTLNLGESVVLILEHPVFKAHSSLDRIVSIESIEGTSVLIRANELGNATVTVFLKSGQSVVYRIGVPAKDIEVPRYQESLNRYRLSGTRGNVGTNVGFHSNQSLFETLTLQEEFLTFRAPKSDSAHSIELLARKPIAPQSDPPIRQVESVAFLYEKTGGEKILVGDTNTQLRGIQSRGSIRGFRVDIPFKSFYPFLVGGILHGGESDFLLARHRSLIGGAGIEYRVSDVFSVYSHGIGFEENSSLRLLSSGWEGSLALTLHKKPLDELQLETLFDKRGRGTLGFSSLWDFDPLQISASYRNSAANIEAYTLPNRFGEAYSSYSFSGTIAPKEALQAGVSLAKTQAIVTQDGFEGVSDLSGSSVSFTLQPLSGLKNSIFGNLYRSQFSPYSLGTSTTEDGRRIEVQNEFAISPRKFLTFNGEVSQIESSVIVVDYENQNITLGYKHTFFEGEDDYFQMEAGPSHTHYRETPTNDGYFLLVKMSGLLRFKRLDVRGVLQDEQRFSGSGDRNILRAQVDLTFNPSAQHELRFRLFNNFEWMRSIFTHMRGFQFGYTYHFGEGLRSESLLDLIRDQRVSGRVFLDRDGNGIFSPRDLPMPHTIVELEDPNAPRSRRVQTDTEGVFAFESVQSGSKSISVDRRTIETTARLITPSPRHIEVGSGIVAPMDFVFSDLGEVSGTLYNDLNENETQERNEPALTEGKILYRLKVDGAWKQVPSEGGGFSLGGIPPGRVELKLDSHSVPPGYRTDLSSTKIIEVGINSILKVDFPLKAERSLSGVVFIDTNRNRRMDAGEKGLARTTLSFSRRQTKSGPGGEYIFRHLSPSSGKVQTGEAFSEPVRLGEEPISLIGVNVPVNP